MEVDYLFGAKDENFFQQMEALPKRFDLGMFAKLEEKTGEGFNGRRIKQKGAKFFVGVERWCLRGCIQCTAKTRPSPKKRSWSVLQLIIQHK